MSTTTATAPESAAAVRARRASRVTMTCDLPVVDRARGERAVVRPTREMCRPTGRPERRRTSGASAVRPTRPQPNVVRSNERFAGVFEHRWIGALIVGGVLAAMVWLVMIVGVGAQDAATPETPAATSVVYVRAGESLTALAHRIAPELPADGVIAQVRKLNGLETSGLTIGQALVVPDYR